MNQATLKRKKSSVPTKPSTSAKSVRPEKIKPTAAVTPEVVTDYSAYITGPEAAKRLGVKPRSIVAYVSQGKLKPHKFQRPGRSGGPENLYDPDQVQALLDQKVAAKTEILAPAPVPFTAVMPGANTAIVKPDQFALLAQHLAALSEKYPKTPPNQRMFLTLDEAVDYTGLGPAYLLANVKHAPNGPNGARVFRRTDLDEL